MRSKLLELHGIGKGLAMSRFKNKKYFFINIKFLKDFGHFFRHTCFHYILKFRNFMVTLCFLLLWYD